MSKITWIVKRECIGIHNELLAWFGGRAGLRDEALLEAALARPRQKDACANASLHQLAAAYAAGIIRNHPFIDGNKRTGFTLAVLFLEVNGRDFTAPETEAAIMTEGLASREVSKNDYAKWLNPQLISKSRG